MNTLKAISLSILAIGLVGSGNTLKAHGPGYGDFDDEIVVTRHFTGAWEQLDQQRQGLSLEVIEQYDSSRKAIAYWYTYGTDRKSAWYLAIGDLVENRIEFELYDSTDVGFMQDSDPESETIVSIGTMTLVFDSCNTGAATFETTHAEVGNGAFDISRVSEVMNTHCSGGISDDMHAGTMWGEQRLELSSARQGVSGNGYARYEDYSGHMEFEITINDIPDGTYQLRVGMHDRGEVMVSGGHGQLEFRSPGETGFPLMTFDPRGMRIELRDGQGVVLSSHENSFSHYESGQHGGDQSDGNGHHYDCTSGGGGGSGPGMGMGGMHDCVNSGEYIEIEVELENTGLLADAEGEVEWRMNSERVDFSVEIEDVPLGSYSLKVAGNEVGSFEAFEMHDGDIYGHIKFRDPETSGRRHLDFEPRGEKVEVLLEGEVVLEVNFPEE